MTAFADLMYLIAVNRPLYILNMRAGSMNPLRPVSQMGSIRQGVIGIVMSNQQEKA